MCPYNDNMHKAVVLCIKYYASCKIEQKRKNCQASKMQEIEAFFVCFFFKHLERKKKCHPYPMIVMTFACTFHTLNVTLIRQR